MCPTCLSATSIPPARYTSKIRARGTRVQARITLRTFASSETCRHYLMAHIRTIVAHTSKYLWTSVHCFDVTKEEIKQTIRIRLYAVASIPLYFQPHLLRKANISLKSPFPIFYRLRLVRTIEPMQEGMLQGVCDDLFNEKFVVACTLEVNEG